MPAQLLRLDQEPFFELLESQPQPGRGIITMLSARLRARPGDQLRETTAAMAQRESGV